MPSYIYDCGSFQDIRPGMRVFWPFGRGYEPRLDIDISYMGITCKNATDIPPELIKWKERRYSLV
jgi:hypothetical protein